MRAAGIRDLKNRLSEYLRLVKGGEVVLVTDRGIVVAELRPPGTASAAADPYPGLTALVRLGIADAVRENDPDAYPVMPKLLPEGEALRMLDELRGDR